MTQNYIEKLKDLLGEAAPYFSVLTGILCCVLPTNTWNIGILTVLCLLTSYSYNLRDYWPRLDKICSYIWLCLIFVNIYVLFLLRK